jgi:hypothetical protein
MPQSNSPADSRRQFVKQHMPIMNLASTKLYLWIQTLQTKQMFALKCKILHKNHKHQIIFEE